MPINKYQVKRARNGFHKIKEQIIKATKARPFGLWITRPETYINREQAENWITRLRTNHASY